MPNIAKHVALILILLALIPPALIMRARTIHRDSRRIHIIQDMDNQAKFRAQHPNAIFADGRAMRPPVAGTVARGEADLDDHFDRGIVNDEWATSFPAQAPLTRSLIARGQDRFGIYCAPCHGYSGYGDGLVHQRAQELMVSGINGTTWVQPKSVHDPAVRDQPPGQLFNTVTNGIRNMHGYAAQVPTEDRWAIVAWVKVLQRSQDAKESDVPANRRENLPVIDLRPPTEDSQ